MTPRAKRTWKIGTITISGAAVLAAIVWGTPKALALAVAASNTANATYVRRDSFAIFQAGLAAKTAHDSAAQDAKLDRLLDVVCEIKPSARACRP